MNLMQRLDANSTWEPNSGCCIWLGALIREHGAIKVNGKQEAVHRVAWELERGPIPKGLWVLHNCGVGPCFNVSHLRLGTREENAVDRQLHGGYVGKAGGGTQAVVRVNDGVRLPFLKPPSLELDQAELRRILVYHPETGLFVWRARSDRDHSWNMQRVGETAGAKSGKGYLYINLETKLHLAHRLAWLYMTGAFPAGHIDHINGDKMDNRWANLRLATAAQNGANVGLRSTNKSGVKGISWDARHKCWYAKITINLKQINLGYFKTLEEATAARRLAEAEHHGDYARTEGTA